MSPTEIKNAFDQLAQYDFGADTTALALVERAVRTANPDEIFVRLNRILNSETFFAARQFACKMIWILGPDRALPALEKLLASADPHLVEAACYAIGTAPSAAADRLLAAAPANPAIANLQAMRRGPDLSDWEIDTPGLWQVRNGVIIGRSPGLKYNDFLRTRKRYANFTLTAKIRMIDGDGNSGIQFRSKPATIPHELEGYQADAGEKYWGSLYDESRRRKTLAGPDDAFRERFDPTIWHTYTIEAQGPHIRLELDGIQTVDYTEPDPAIPQSGIIALQIHAWPHPVEVWFRDLIIQTAT